MQTFIHEAVYNHSLGKYTYKILLIYTYILFDSIQVVPDPVTYIWEVFVLHASQSFVVVFLRVLVRVLHDVIVHLNMGSEIIIKVQGLVCELVIEERGQGSLTKQRERFSSIGLLSPTSTNITGMSQ